MGVCFLDIESARGMGFNDVKEEDTYLGKGGGLHRQLLRSMDTLQLNRFPKAPPEEESSLREG